MKKDFRDTLEESRLLQQHKRNFWHILFSRSALMAVLLAANFAVMFWLLTRLLEQLPLLLGGITVFTACMLLMVINGKQDASIKLAWAVLIAVLPLPGAAFYLFTRLDMGARLSKKAIHASMADSAAFLPPADLQAAPAIAHYLRMSGNAAYRHSHTRYYPLGEAMFADMLEAMRHAETFIFLEYFVVAPGDMWGQMLSILQQKVKEGVEVRLMYDGTNAMLNLPEDYPRQMQKLGIQCKVFSPLLPFLSTHYNNRDHRKILVVDGKIAFTGGVNLQDRYINREQVYGHWKDTGICVQGPAAHGFTLMFLQLWNADEKVRSFAPYLQPAKPVQSNGWVIPFGDQPTDDHQVGKRVYLDILSRAQRYVYIMTPYLILDNEMENALKFAAQRGVDVRLILPHIPDKVTVFALAKGHYPALTAAGVKIFEYTPGFVHGKVFLSDDHCGVVGTVNLDYRSLYHHYECGVYLYEADALKQMAEDFAATFPLCRQITPAEAAHLPLGYRIGSKLLKAFAPLM